MIIVDLNIRGMGGIKSRYLNHIIAREGAEFVCLQETKTREVTEAKCFAVWGNNRIGWIHHEGDNGNGSLLSMWHKEAFSYDSHVVGKGFIAVVGTHIKANLKCVLVNVYATCILRDKKILWEELTSVKEALQVPVWCLCGDFNVVRSRCERKGIRVGVDSSSEIVGFNSFIENNMLFDLPIVGKNFTWFKPNGTAKSRIDRVLVSEEWLVRWPMSKQYVQSREVSDHCAIVVKDVQKDWGPKPFRSLDIWLQERSFCGMVKDFWLAYSVEGNAFVRFKEKLKSLKGDLKKWNRDVFGNIYTVKREIL